MPKLPLLQHRRNLRPGNKTPHPTNPDAAPPHPPSSTPAPILALVDVVVTDRGYPIHGLDKNQFRILEDGREQTIASFDEHQPNSTATIAVTAPKLPPHTFTNVPTYPETQTVNVLLLDGLNTLLPDQMRVRQQMLDYMGQIQPGTPL